MGQTCEIAPVLFTLCEIALPIWQVRGSPSAVLWDKLMTLLLCYLGSLKLRFLYDREGAGLVLFSGTSL